ncbi:MAG: hypothetical protein WD425_00070 [Nitrospirales bacterium]
MASSYKIVHIMAGLLLLLIPACSDSSTDSVSKAPVVEQPGFTGNVSGAVSGEISGPGVATYLPPQDTIDGVRPGYYLIANARGTTELLITFRIPAGTKAGTYQLVTVDPMELGEKFEVRIEGTVDGKPVAFGSNTEGTLTLDIFPEDGEKLAGAKIEGSFQFATQAPEGDSLSLSGTFEFLA